VRPEPCHVPDVATGGANKVAVGRKVGVPARRSAGGPDLHHDPLFLENVQVPVDGAKRDVGELLTDTVEDPLGGRMTSGAAYRLQHHASLAGFP